MMGLRALGLQGILSATVGALVWLLPGSASALNVALEDFPLGTCQSSAGDVFERVTTILTNRGHTVTVVDGTSLDTPAEIDQFDVVSFGGGAFSCDWDWASFDGQLQAYVQNGGGIVVTGWAAYYMASNTKNETYPGLESVLPVLPGLAAPAGTLITIVPGHPITNGVNDFVNPHYNSHGAGVPVGATVLMTDNGVDSGAAWEVGNGRAVYLGPIYLANWGGYDNEALLDGTLVTAELLYVQAIEWAAACQDDTDCDDGDVCNGIETCVNGDCTPGNTLVCDDSNVCTNDSCDSQNGCQNVPNNDACDDASVCTSSDICSGGTCSGQPLDCDDGDGCTDDSCDAVDGCQYVDNTNVCDDSDACTDNDVCGGGACAGTTIDCDDNNVCTDDSCDSVNGCGYVDNTDVCDDGDACTESEICSNGVCSGAPLDCDDNDLCTLDTCDAVAGCFNGPVQGCCTGDGECALDEVCDLATNECVPAGAGGGGTGGSATGGSGGANGDESDPDSSGGCGCELPGRAGDSAAWWALAGLALLPWWRRRRGR